jgi:alanine dehydrogenase
VSAPAETITYLDRATVRSLLPDATTQVDLLADTYRKMAAGRVENPPKIGVHARPSTFVHAMPAYLRDNDVTAMKWVGAYPGNPGRGLPYISGLIVLNDSASGLPVAVMDGAEITAARTAAASGVSIRHLAHPGWRRVALLGFGEQGRAHVAVLRSLSPAAEIRVYGGPRLTGPQPGVEVAPDARSAVEGADVVVTAGPMAPDPQRRLERSWLPERCLVVPVDFDAYVRADLADAADLLVVDDLEQFDHYRSLGYFDGWPAPRTSLGEAVDSSPYGDLRLSCSLGVGAVDAALADLVRQRAEAEGLGVPLPR